MSAEYFLACWECDKLHPLASFPADATGILCRDPDCDGYVISPSGKVRIVNRRDPENE